MSKSINLTKSFVENAPAPTGKDQIFYRDSKLTGFALRVTSSKTKSFVVETTINNKVRRITIGKYGALTTETARKEAKKLLGDIARGKDPIAEKQATKAKQITLSEVFADYLRARKSLKPKTIYDYKRVMNVALVAWSKKALASITKDKITKIHAQLGEEHGHAYANLSMRVLRAIFNFAAGQYEDNQGRSLVTENPVKRLSQTRSWYRVERRQTYIKAGDLAIWHQGIQTLENETLRDYLLLILFTGLRRQEAARLRWEAINLKAKTLTVSDTKNSEIHILPLSDYLLELLNRRMNVSVSEFVFAGSGSHGHIIEPRKQMAKAIEASGISFTVHDLRRTFITIAESLDISAYALKRLLNHKMSGDITASYIISDVERLRKPMQQISDHLRHCMTPTSKNIVPFISPHMNTIGL
jgi:integrase